MVGEVSELDPGKTYAYKIEAKIDNGLPDAPPPAAAATADDKKKDDSKEEGKGG